MNRASERVDILSRSAGEKNDLQDVPSVSRLVPELQKVVTGSLVGFDQESVASVTDG